MNNGCPKCENLQYINGGNLNEFMLCIDCQIEQADADVLKAMNRLEELKKKKEKNELSNNKTD